MVVSAVAVTELVLLLGIALVAFGRPMLDAARGQGTGTTRSTPARPAASHARAPTVAHRNAPLSAPSLTRGETSVLILNGNGIAGAGAAEAKAVRAKGYIVAAVGNAKRTDYARSVVMYRPGYKPESARLARDLHLNVVSPLDGIRAGELMGAHVAVVLGR